MSQHDTGQTGRPIGHGPTAVHPAGIRDIHREATEIANGSDDEREWFVVSVEVSDVLAVRAKSAEEALAMAVTGNPDGSDLDVDCISHDVHACVHSGDEHEHEGDDEGDEE